MTQLKPTALDMPKSNSRRDAKAGRKRGISLKGLSSTTTTSKRQKTDEREISIPASAPGLSVSSRLRLCLACSALIYKKGGTPVIVDSSDCPSCELITNAFPMNDVAGITVEIKNECRYSTYVTPASHDYYDVEIRREEGFRLYGTVRIDSNITERPDNIPETIDFDVSTAWLERCKKVHGASCDRHDFPLRYSKPIDIIVVDVVQDCITSMTTACRYFALSYVWGGAITTTTTMQNLADFQQPGSLKNDLAIPKTVSDAILLTRKLGVRYLWVDCFSIIQDSPKKHQDIADMDVIFSQAELTIVAVGSRNANSGLPGVYQGTRRHRVMSKVCGSHILTLQLPFDKPDLLFGTSYNSRGWTFQELLVSKRMLFVTEAQVSFYCGISQCSESFPTEQVYDATLYGFGHIELRPKQPGADSDNIIRHSYTTMVREYCTKRLSFQNDIENAFSGLASILEQWCEGCPVIHGMMSNNFGYSMLWTFSHSQATFCPYSKEERGKRRKAFPSWSWVGWVASVSNIGAHSALVAPLRSLMRNVEITKYVERSVSLSFNVMDDSAQEDDANAAGQQIKLNLEPIKIDSDTLICSTLEFDAQRTEWKNFTTKHSIAPNPIFFFGPPGTSSVCGFLSIVPDENIGNELFDQVRTLPESNWEWSLARLYQLRLSPWNGIGDNVQCLLDDIEYDGAFKFRERLQRSNLLYVLLIRRQGQHWERMGSGLMFERYWPSTSTRAKVRAHRERIVLI